jgi:hypothetical protein
LDCSSAYEAVSSIGDIWVTTANDEGYKVDSLVSDCPWVVEGDLAALGGTAEVKGDVSKGCAVFTIKTAACVGGPPDGGAADERVCGSEPCLCTGKEGKGDDVGRRENGKKPSGLAEAGCTDEGGLESECVRAVAGV